MVSNEECFINFIVEGIAQKGTEIGKISVVISGISDSQHIAV